MERKKLSLINEVARLVYRTTDPKQGEHKLIMKLFKTGDLGDVTEAEMSDLIQTLRTNVSYIMFENEALKREKRKQ